jgi:purine-nucleoside phosphorylase
MRENMTIALDQATDFLKRKISFTPSIGIILGTGVSSFGEKLTVKDRIPYQEIPFFPVPTVASHAGQLVNGLWKERPVMVLAGRMHYYEGYSLQEVTFPIRVLRMLGISTLVITNAAGGLDPDFSAGDLMVITDHINLIDDNPLRGPNLDRIGNRFPSMHEPYCHHLIKKTEDVAGERGIVLRKGVYAAVAGPSMETPAETHFLRMIGADAVGMSTVPEVIVAIHAGMRVLGLSVISNVNRPEYPAPAPLEEVIAVVQKAKPNLISLIEGVLDHL